ncbi:ExeM/NucH family extracellular endonuclease [Microbacterium pygmaeum]|uniref:ExeM/NucH family extracellular endonuclease n=1 Tax=Microbacterium pygmaeum TaxID=370764 RepID=UPI000AD3EF90|nr:ExeM/NucH family extracellular endonuclease [Microbacterium pygmaeum]
MRRLTAVSALAAAALLLAGLTAPAASAAEGDLLFSEVIEGSSNNKAIEIYNPTTAPVDLAAAQYSVVMYFNGNAAAGTTVALTGTVAAGDVHVLALASANEAILAAADQTSAGSWFNGDDTLVLTKAGSPVDVFGQLGVDPGTEWGTGLTSTQDNTVRRKVDVCIGDPNGADAFDVAAQWDGFAVDTIDGLGAHAAVCALEPPVDPPVDPPAEADCDVEPVSIGSVQGSGATTPVPGASVLVEGTVVGDFQTGGFDGYYVQDDGDGDPATSDAVFVSAPGGTDVSAGDQVSVAGTVGEAFGMTQLTPTGVEVCASGTELPEATPVTLPIAPEQYEALEGMYVTLPQQLSIGETFDFARYGTITLTAGRQYQPTGLHDAGSPEAIALAAKNAAETITVDDGRSAQNPDPAIHPDGSTFTLENTFRSGDLVTGTTGVLDYRFDTWAIQPTQGAEVAVGNPRTPAPEVDGDLKVASFNVLNYFTTLTGPDARGANDPEEFQRQEEKIVTALTEIDADVFGLIEIENNGTAVAALTTALNTRLGADVYDYVETGVIGTDVITTALLYKPASVTPAGAFQLMDQSKDARWLDDFNRPGLTQSFTDAAGATFTVVVNHLKSKGSDCNAVGDPVDPNGQGNCNGVRTQAASALADWLATDPTGQGAGRELVLGDLNSYSQEDPMQALYAAGYTDVTDPASYTYVFDGQLGSLDHALAGPGIVGEVTDAAVWNVNADEPSILDYDTTFKLPAQDALYAPDAYRSSDHDPVVVGLDLIPPDTTAPTLRVEADPAYILLPLGQTRTVKVDVQAADDSGEVTVTLVSATATGAPRASVQTISDTRFTVRAVNNALYTFTYTATDAAGNSTTVSDTVGVGPKRFLDYLCESDGRIAGSICR